MIAVLGQVIEMSPWQILGLNPDGADRASVRRAYAKLIQINRPDENPEEFQKIRAAYEEACRQLDSGLHSSSPAIELEEFETYSEPLSVQEPELVVELSAPHCSRERAREIIAEIVKTWRESAKWSTSLVQIMEEHFDRNSALLVDSMSVADCALELERGELQVTEALIRAWGARCEWHRPRELGDVLMSEVHNIGHELAFTCAHGLLELMIIVDNEYGRRLANWMSSLIPPQQAWVLNGERNDELVIVGQTLLPLTQEFKVIIAKAIAHGSADLADPRVHAAFVQLWYQGEAQLARELIQQRCPGLLESLRKNRKPPVQIERIPLLRRLPDFSNFPYWIAGALLLITLLRSCASMYRVANLDTTRSDSVVVRSPEFNKWSMPVHDESKPWPGAPAELLKSLRALAPESIKVRNRIPKDEDQAIAAVNAS